MAPEAFPSLVRTQEGLGEVAALADTEHADQGEALQVLWVVVADCSHPAFAGNVCEKRWSHDLQRAHRAHLEDRRVDDAVEYERLEQGVP